MKYIRAVERLEDYLRDEDNDIVQSPSSKKLKIKLCY